MQVDGRTRRRVDDACQALRQPRSSRAMREGRPGAGLTLLDDHAQPHHLISIDGQEATAVQLQSSLFLRSDERSRSKSSRLSGRIICLASTSCSRRSANHDRRPSRGASFVPDAARATETLKLDRSLRLALPEPATGVTEWPLADAGDLTLVPPDGSGGGGRDAYSSPIGFTDVDNGLSLFPSGGAHARHLRLPLPPPGRILQRP